jgi:hypothetical protein
LAASAAITEWHGQQEEISDGDLPLTLSAKDMHDRVVDHHRHLAATAMFMAESWCARALLQLQLQLPPTGADKLAGAP